MLQHIWNKKHGLIRKKGWDFIQHCYSILDKNIYIDIKKLYWAVTFKENSTEINL